MEKSKYVHLLGEGSFGVAVQSQGQVLIELLKILQSPATAFSGLGWRFFHPRFGGF